MPTYKAQIKKSDGTMQDLDLDAKTLDGKDSAYYLDYNNLNNKPTSPGGSGGATDEQVMEIIANNSKETDTLEIGTSSNYNVASDTQIPTTKTVQSIVNMALGDIESLLEAI